MKNELRIAGIIRESIVDGPGIRFVVFTQGCFHACPGCQNPDTHDPDGGKTVTIEKIISEIKKNPLLAGITISGGEPFLQAEECALLANEVKKLGLGVIAYTGYTVEELLGGIEKSGWRRLLLNCDTLVDGEFIESEKNLLLKFRGSNNQRIIDPSESVKRNEAVIKDDF